MKVSDLIEQLKEFPQDFEVYYDASWADEGECDLEIAYVGFDNKQNPLRVRISL